MNIKIRDVLDGVLNALTSSADFHPHPNRDPEIWDTYIPTWSVRSFEYTHQVDNEGKDELKIVFAWTATIIFPSGRTREVSTTYSFHCDYFSEHYGIHGLIMNFHSHVARALQLSTIPKE